MRAEDLPGEGSKSEEGGAVHEARNDGRAGCSMRQLCIFLTLREAAWFTNASAARFDVPHELVSTRG